MTRLLFLISLCSFAAIAGANTKLDQAYNLYLERQNHKQLTHAKKIYLSVLEDKNNSLEDRSEALDRFSRLSVFEGEIYRQKFSIKSSKAADIFESCIKATDNLSPKAIEQNIPEYSYWRSVCIGLWANHGSGFSWSFARKVGDRFSELKNLVKEGQELFPDFDERGFFRIEAGMILRSQVLKAFNLYNPENSPIKLLEYALEHENANNYFTHLMYAETLIKKKNHVKAAEFLSETIDILEKRLIEGSIPEDLVTENQICLEKLKIERKKIVF